MPDLLTVAEIAAELKVADGTVRTAIRKGHLPSQRKYGSILVTRADLDAYKQRTRPDGEKPRGRPKKAL